MPDGFRSAPVAVDELVVVVAPDHSWAARHHRAEELAATPLVLRETGSGTRATLEEWLRVRGLGIASPAAELATTSAIRAAVMAGVAPAVLSRRATQDDLAVGRLCQVDVEGPSPQRRLVAVWLSPRLSSIARALVEIAARSIDGPVRW